MLVIFQQWMQKAKTMAVELVPDQLIKFMDVPTFSIDARVAAMVIRTISDVDCNTLAPSCLNVVV